MKIADIDLGPQPLFLAPMEDVTDPSFRYMCKRFGADVVTTEFISCDGLIRDAWKSRVKLRIDDAERPVGIQIYGHLIEPMVEAARIAESASPDFIDINFGCPVRKIAGRGAGSGMMRDVPTMVEMTRRIVEAVHTPVTVKTRLGWDEDSKNIVEIALRLQDVGIASITIHGRTRSDGYKKERIDYASIAAIKQRIRIPLIANGEIASAADAKRVLEITGANGVMIGRAAIKAPWIFWQIAHNTSEIPPIVRKDLILEHFDKMVEFYGARGVVMFRKNLHAYSKSYPGAGEFRNIVNAMSDPIESRARIEEFFGQEYIDQELPQLIHLNKRTSVG